MIGGATIVLSMVAGDYLEPMLGGFAWTVPGIFAAAGLWVINKFGKKI